MELFDQGPLTALELFQHKLLNARAVDEAEALFKIAKEKPYLLREASGHTLEWDIDKPLCQQCMQELAGKNGFCAICQAVLEQIDGSQSKTDTGILISCQNTSDLAYSLSQACDGIFFPINNDALLILSPPFKVWDLIAALHEAAPGCSQLTNIVFPGKGDMSFGDALAMARYYAESVQPPEDRFLTKFFFSHSHMRAFDHEDYLPFAITHELLKTASKIKSAFNPEDRSVIRDILQKEKLNRIYELNRFYSLCNQNQKAILGTLQMDELDPKSALLLFQLVKYVYRSN